MGQALSPVTRFVAEHLDKSAEELASLVEKTFPGTETTGRRYWGTLSRARAWLRSQGRPVPALHPRRPTQPATERKKRGGRKPGSKNKPNGSVPAPEAPDPFSTPDAKQLTALIMRVGLNTAEAVMARLKHIEERQQR